MRSAQQLSAQLRTTLNWRQKPVSSNRTAHDTVVIYQLDLNALQLSDKGTAAVQTAFAGDFTKLAEAARDPQSGVTELQSISIVTKSENCSLTVHLLNFAQAGEVTETISKETVKALPGGDLCITDTETARTTEFVCFPAKPEGLRKLLFTSALLTSAYQGNTKADLRPNDGLRTDSLPV